MDKKILVYGIDDKRDVISEISKNFDIEVKFLDESDLSQKLGYLFGIDGFEKEANENLTEDLDFFIFSDFDRELLREYLIELNKKNVLVPHKAVLTDTNKNWTLFYLMDHIKDEHEMVGKFRELGALVKRADVLIKENPEDLDLKFAFNEAMKLRGVELEMKSLDENLKRMKEALDKYE